jgi:hypothetical protein
MSFSSNKKKETAVQDTFYNLCKDLIRYIDKKIVKKYISPNQAQVPKEKRIKEKVYNDNKWRYFYEDDETTEEDRIKDIFKNNKFLFILQNLYDTLGVVVNDMENNKKNLEILEEQMRMEQEKLKINSEINTQMLKYLIDNKINDINSINQNDFLKAFENLKNNNVIKNINPDMIQQFMSNTNNINLLQSNINMQNNSNSNNNNLMNNNSNANINNNNDLVKENNIKLNNKNKLMKNKSIPTLIQALEAINKSKNNKKNINYQKDSSNKVIQKNNILDSDSNDSDDSDNNEKDEEEEDEKEEKEKKEEKEENNKKNNIYEKNKYKKNENKNKKFLNRKIKRKNDNNKEIIDINDYI